MRKNQRAKRFGARNNRPSVEELGGTSEYQVRAASGPAEGDPMQSVVQPAPQEAGDLMEPAMATGQRKGGPPDEDVSVEADDLGLHFLQGAVQDWRAVGQDEQLPASEDIELSEGERRMLENYSDVETVGEIVTHLPERTEREAELSELANDAVHEVQQARRGPRARRAPEQLAKERKLATRRASERRQ